MAIYFKKFATTFFDKQKNEKIHPNYGVPITELKINLILGKFK